MRLTFTLQAVVSRMKTIQHYLPSHNDAGLCALRFVAVSATIPNTDDIAEWLGKNGEPALSFMYVFFNYSDIKIKSSLYSR